MAVFLISPIVDNYPRGQKLCVSEKYPKARTNRMGAGEFKKAIPAASGEFQLVPNIRSPASPNPGTM